MIYIIKKGKHRARWWWLSLSLWHNKTLIRRKVIFKSTAVYDLNSKDQEDTNKLFGIGYFPYHHKESARVGWRYDWFKKKFILSAYCYVNGDRVMHDFCECYANKKLEVIILISPVSYEFLAYDHDTNISLGSITIPHWNRKKWSYPLGLYFGGNKPAPDNIQIEIEKH